MTLALRIPRAAGVLATGAVVGLLSLGTDRRKRTLRRVRDALALLGRGHARAWRAVSLRVYSRSRSIGLARDLTLPFQAPAARIPVIVRPLGAQDHLAFLDPVPGLSSKSAWYRRLQRRLLMAGLPGCWIAVKTDGKPCYMQWLVTGKDGARARALWGDLFPTLAAGEALVEGIFTAEDHRRAGIMGHAMAQIAEAATGLGVRRVLVFVSERNAASLKGCRKAGFVPYIERIETWFLFRRRVRFTPV